MLPASTGVSFLESATRRTSGNPGRLVPSSCVLARTKRIKRTSLSLYSLLILFVFISIISEKDGKRKLLAHKAMIREWARLGMPGDAKGKGETYEKARLGLCFSSLLCEGREGTW